MTMTKDSSLALRIGLGLTLLLLVLSSGPLFLGTISGQTSSTPPSIPAGLISYIKNALSSNPDASRCVQGTISPFTVTSTSCNTPEGSNLVTYSQTTNCGNSGTGTHCINGGETDYSSGYAGYIASTTAPTPPTNSYYYPTASFADWIGIQNSVTSGIDLLQVGEAFGVNSSYKSTTPVLFTEFVDPSSECTSLNSTCASFGPTVATGAGLDLEILYSSASPASWTLYAADTASDKYTSLTVLVGNGLHEVSWSKGDYGLAMSEGWGLSSSTSNYPAGVNYYNVVGSTSSYSYALGSQISHNNPSTGSESVTLSWSTGSCSGFTGTCGDQDIIVS